MAGKRVKAKDGVLDKIMKVPSKAGENLATYLLEGLYLSKKKGGTKSKTVKAKK